MTKQETIYRAASESFSAAAEAFKAAAERERDQAQDLEEELPEKNPSIEEVVSEIAIAGTVALKANKIVADNLILVAKKLKEIV